MLLHLLTKKGLLPPFPLKHLITSPQAPSPTPPSSSPPSLPNLSLVQSLLPPRDILLTYPSSFICDPSSILPRIEEEEEVIVMLKEKFLIDPVDSIFVHAYGVLAKLRREDWDAKVGFLKGLGWEEEELVVSAFKKHPYFMTASMEKLGRNMGVFKEGFGWDVEYAAKYPSGRSFVELREEDKLRVMRVLIEEGLFQGKIAARQLVLGKEEFWRRYVEKFKESVPRLVDAVQGF